tara:strand:+ start:139 stop:327 length:189 start_codon:yes stop_codon:yes gene_type:complete
MRKSYKTTLWGLAGAIATYLMGLDDPAWLATLGKALMALSVFFLGKNARDRDVTSEMENGTG